MAICKKQSERIPELIFYLFDLNSLKNFAASNTGEYEIQWNQWVSETTSTCSDETNDPDGWFFDE